MFRLGQRIIITSSNLSKSQHPNVGDIGYVGSVFLFPQARFLLVELFLYFYPEEPKDRCERKIVMIDLGIEKGSAFKRTFTLGTINRAQVIDHLMAGHVGINLTCPTLFALHNVDNRFTYSNLIWPWFCRRNQDNLNRSIKMPIVEMHPTNKLDPIDSSIGSLCAWINSTRPVFVAARSYEDSLAILDRINRFVNNSKSYGDGTYIFYATPKQMQPRKPHPWFKSSVLTSELIEAVRKFEAIFRLNKETAIKNWAKTNLLPKEVRSALYKSYVERLGYPGELYSLAVSNALTRELMTEMYFLILSSGTMKEAHFQTYRFGKMFFEVRGDYYDMHTSEIAEKILEYQVKVIKGEITLKEYFCVQYLK